MSGNLTEIEIPSTVQFIGKQAFYKCDSLNSIKFNSIYNWFVLIDGANFNLDYLDDPLLTASNLTSEPKYYNADMVHLIEN